MRRDEPIPNHQLSEMLLHHLHCARQKDTYFIGVTRLLLALISLTTISKSPSSCWLVNNYYYYINNNNMMIIIIMRYEECKSQDVGQQINGSTATISWHKYTQVSDISRRR